MKSEYANHYKYLEEFIPSFFESQGVSWDSNRGIIVAHGDKCSGYRDKWEKSNIPFHKGVAIYLLGYCRPFSEEVRDTRSGWVDPGQWVIDNFSRFEKHLP